MILSKFDIQMINTISEYYPYSPHDVKRVWEKSGKSWDKTIYCLKMSSQLGVQLDDLID